MRITHAGIARLAKWLQEELSMHTLGQREKPVQAFSLMHVEAGIAEREVRTIKIGTTVDPMVLARAFFDAATNYASEITSGSGLQQFIVYAHIDGVDPLPHHPLKVSGASDMSLTGTEPPTNQGHMSQLMRHNEALVGAVVRMNDRLLSNQENMWRVQEEAMHQRLETLQLTETVIMQAAEGEHQKKLELLSLEENRHLKRKLIDLAPALGSMIGLPVPVSAVDTSILEAIANELSADDLEQFVSIMRLKLKPEVMAVMSDRLGKIIDEKKRKDAEASAIVPNGNASKEETH